VEGTEKEGKGGDSQQNHLSNLGWDFATDLQETNPLQFS